MFLTETIALEDLFYQVLSLSLLLPVCHRSVFMYIYDVENSQREDEQPSFDLGHILAFTY
jgi:hypothetical protein